MLVSSVDFERCKIHKMLVAWFFQVFHVFHIFHGFPKCWLQVLISKDVKFTKCSFQGIIHQNVEFTKSFMFLRLFIFSSFPKCWFQGFFKLFKFSSFNILCFYFLVPPPPAKFGASNFKFPQTYLCRLLKECLH